MLTKKKDKDKMKCGNERKTSSSSPRLDSEVGLGLNMQLQASDSYSCCGTGGGGGPYFSSTGNQVACLYGVADGMFVPRSFHNTASGGMAVSGKALFTASQWQELERQNTIYKYIQASITVPPQLLLPTSSSPHNTSGSSDLRFSSSGIDPEAWRCKRTDGKKWRCSRDVAPQQKYCERHAHKNKPRSRKLVDFSSHNTPRSHKPLHCSTSQFTALSSPSFDQTSDTNSVSARKKQQQQLEQLMQMSSSPRMDDLNNSDPNKSMSVYHPHFENKQGFITLNPYMSDYRNSILDPKMEFLQEETQTTRHLFIDAWGKEGYDAPLSKDFPVSPSSPPLSLSISGGNYDYEKGDSGIHKMSADRESDGIWKPEWMTQPVPWMNSPPPGGPLGEVLCLGNANTTRGGFDLASAQGYSYTGINTNSSSCSKSSCEESSHALNFIG